LDIVINFRNSQPSWVQIVSAFGVPSALLIAVGNAWWQSRLLRRQLKQAIFEKRFLIYLTVRGFIGQICKSLHVELQECFKFLYDKNQAEFLFEPPVEAFIKEVYRKATELHAVNEILRDSPNRDQRRLEEKHQLERWFAVDAHETAKGQFTPYLRLYDHDRSFRSAWLRMTESFRRLKKKVTAWRTT